MCRGTTLRSHLREPSPRVYQTVGCGLLPESVQEVQELLEHHLESLFMFNNFNGCPLLSSTFLCLTQACIWTATLWKFGDMFTRSRRIPPAELWVYWPRSPLNYSQSSLFES